MMRSITRTILACALLACAASAGAQTRFVSHARFANVGAASDRPAATSASAMLFGAVPASPVLGALYSSHAGAQVALDASIGEQASIDSVRLYAYAMQTGVYQRITARFRLWGGWNDILDPVFDAPTEYVVELAACPCNFDAGNAYAVDIDLPKPFYSRGASVGFSETWLTDPGNGVLSVSSDLVPALDGSGAPATVGDTLAAYGNLGRSPDDLDFGPADVSANAVLGLELRGSAMTLDQCTGANGFRDQFDEEFDDATAFFQRWKVNPNNGTLSVGSGRLELGADDAAAQFPYVASKQASTVIPPSGNFSVRWLARYTGVGRSGDGEMAISRTAPLNGSDGNADPVSLAFRSWQDKDGFYLYPNTAAGTQVVGGGQGSALHDIQYCWVDGKVEVWKDGVRVFGPAAQPAQRPDSLWFGNPVVAGAGPWNAVTLYRVLVRGDQVTLSDRIFSDDFEPQAP